MRYVGSNQLNFLKVSWTLKRGISAHSRYCFQNLVRVSEFHLFYISTINVLKMGSLGDEDDAKIRSLESDTTEELDHEDAATQIFDSQFSPSSFHGGELIGEYGDRMSFLQSTLNDTVNPEDDFETQVMNFETQVANFGGETQVVNLGGETEAVSLCGETQVLNLGNENQTSDVLDSYENCDTQLFDDYDTEVVVDTDGEGSERTEVFDDTDELSDDGSRKQVCASRPGKETKQCSASPVNAIESNKAVSDSPICDQRDPGFTCRGFTSIRTASVRASGLAACNMAALKDHNSQSCSTLSESLSLKKHDSEHIRIPFNGDSCKYLGGNDQDCIAEEYSEQIKGPRNENPCRVGRPTARKLFSEDTLGEIEDFNDHVNSAGGRDLPSLFDNELAGLSYVDSQEPGESSQANALNFVDSFLKVNVIDFDQEDNFGKCTRGKLEHVSCAKGTQSLAKSAKLISTVGERGIFDWDNNREDEGGGEFFRKKKEAFFDGGSQKQRSFPQSQKTRRACSKSDRVVYRSSDKEKHLGIHDKLTGLVSSDSRMGLVSRKGTEASANFVGTPSKLRKNLIQKLNEQTNLASKDGMTESSTDNDIPEMPNIRFDTQMAAEAMETLYFGVPMTGQDTNNAHQDSSTMLKGSNEQQLKKNAQMTGSMKILKPKGTATEFSKNPFASSRKRSIRVRKQRNQEAVNKPKRLKANAKELVTSNESENLRKAPCNFIEQRRKEGTLRERDVDGIDGCHVDASCSPLSVKKQCIPENLTTFTPIACRTRQSVKVNKSENANDTSSGFREEMNELAGVYPKRRRTSLRFPSLGQEVNGQSIARSTRSKSATWSNGLDLNVKRKIRSLVAAAPVLHPLGCQPGGKLVQLSADKEIYKDASLEDNSVVRNGNTAETEVSVGQVSNPATKMSDSYIMRRSEKKVPNARIKGSPRERCKPSTSACTTPVSCATPVKEASPICMGDEYLKQSSRRSSSKTSLIKELDSLVRTESETISPNKDSRRRRDMADVQVLFSRHLDGDIIKQQKKILSRLGASVVSSVSDATHFVADEFVRTKNMLEAIALGKPVVTHLWLESCGQACCLIDEKKYILRDAKKEKEFGFSLPVSLARACERPLLRGQRVLITSNTKPGNEILSSLVKAVHGSPFERIGRTALKDNIVPDNLLVLSCEEDYADCVPFLEKGAGVYSSELLLNGIVTQRLEYGRHRLFADHFRRTRSTLWIKKNTNEYHPVTKCK